MKKLLAILLVLCMVFSFAACKPSEEEVYESNKQAYTDFLADFNDESVLATNARVITDANGDKMLLSDIQNNSAEPISEIVLGFAIWNAEGAPMVIKSKRNPTNEIYEFQMEATNITVEANTTWNATVGVYLDASCGEIAYQKAVVVSYKKADGTTFENPLYSAWKETYLQQNLEDYMR